MLIIIYFKWKQRIAFCKSFSYSHSPYIPTEPVISLIYQSAKEYAAFRCVTLRKKEKKEKKEQIFVFSFPCVYLLESVFEIYFQTDLHWWCVLCNMVWCGVCFLVLRSLLLLSSLVAKERHMIFDYNVNESKTQLLLMLMLWSKETPEYYLAACFAFV